MKSANCLLHLFLIMFFLNSTIAMVTDGGFSKNVYAGESGSINDLLDNVHLSSIHDPRFLEHEHLFDFGIRKTFLKVRDSHLIWFSQVTL